MITTNKMQTPMIIFNVGDFLSLLMHLSSFMRQLFTVIVVLEFPSKAVPDT